MPAKFKSKLFQRNKGGIGGRGAGLYMPRMQGGFRAPNPAPPKSTKSSNYLENKSLTGGSASLALQETGQVFHLDQITQGAGVTQRLGQKAQITGVHIRGSALMNNSNTNDTFVYYLVWDKSPNEALATPGDIINLGGFDAAHAFPNLDTSDRFIILGRKSHICVNANTGVNDRNVSMYWNVDDYFQFSRKLVSTTVLSGSGLISDRVSGALLLVGCGTQGAGFTSTLNFGYRCYFNDV